MDTSKCLGCLFFIYIGCGLQHVSACVTQTYSDGNKVLTLSCLILNFTNFATWSLDGIGQQTRCLNDGFCTVNTNGNYNFTSDNDGIYIRINPYSSTENGKVWKCDHPPIDCNTTVKSPESPTVTAPEETSTTITVGQITSSQIPSNTSHSKISDTLTGTTTDNDFSSTSGRVTQEITTDMKTDKIVGTVISFAIPVGIFLIMVALMIFIIIRLRRSKRIRTKKCPNEPRRHKKTVTRKPNSSEDIFYLNESNSPTLTNEFHQTETFNNKGHVNSFHYPLSYYEPYSSHWNKLYNDRQRPDVTYGQGVMLRSMGYSIYQGDATIQNGRSRRNNYH